MSMHQHTIAKSLRFTGTGLHSGASVNVTLHPAAPDHGIVFQRTDMPAKPLIPAHASLSKPTPLCTTLSTEEGAVIRTIEHLMSGLAAMNIDNVLVSVDGGEIPLLDGSALPFYKELAAAGATRQNPVREAIIIREAVEVKDGDKWARLVPDTRRRFQMTIDFAHPLIAQQTARFDLGETGYEIDIAPARTFGFLKDFEALRAAGLIKGGSLESAVVFDDSGVVNPEGLRFADEPARHKLLDAIGDLALAGMPIVGRYEGYKASHALNSQLVQALLAAPECWTKGRMEKDGESGTLPASKLFSKTR